MRQLNRFIHMTLAEAREFDEWLSPDVVRLLINNYAKKNSNLGLLNWEYTTDLRRNTWGVYKPHKRTLYVNKHKTKGAFKQQVETILHEIQHWNQHVDIAEEIVDLVDDEVLQAIDRYEQKGLKVPDEKALVKASVIKHAYHTKTNRYSAQSARVGYWKNSYEVDAREFASNNLEEAIKKIANLYGGRVEGELEDVIDELVGEYEDTEQPLSKGLIGRTLVTYGFIGGDYTQQVLQQLADLEIPVRAGR